MEELKLGNSQISLCEGDITEQAADAIVNAANGALVLGAGVAGAIRSKGGPEIQKECDMLGGTPVGTAVMTTGGNLKAKHVIHAVGPRMGEGDEDAKLKSATKSSLEVADQNNLRSMTFPAISTGIFGFPVDRCAKIMLETTADYLREKTALREVRFCLWGDESFGVFQKALMDVSAEMNRDE